ncbi:MAG: hypothetical protein CMA12_07435 [Euryarchaeota archaeon]|nr:hypothetical protein [Euryarchaeota archaeon]
MEGVAGTNEVAKPDTMIRLSDYAKTKFFRGIDGRFGVLDSLLTEGRYSAYLILNFWGSRELVMILLCIAGFLLGTWDVGIGELSGGGDYNRRGILGGDESGFLHISDFALILSLLSLISWASFLVLLWISYPIMRENMVYLVIGMSSIQFGYIKAHADTPRFPADAEISGWIWIIVVNMIMLFLSIFVVRRAVTETRDIHVQRRHAHPDPRVIDRARKDHSLKTWSVAIGLWILLLNVSFWSSTHSVAPSPGELDFSYFLVFVYLATGVLASILLLAIIWMPEFMLGTTEKTIQSSRAREVAGEEIEQPRAEQGKCPVCNQQTLSIRESTGIISSPCGNKDCSGKGEPGTKCDQCETKIPSRLICGNCGSNTPVGSHFGRVEAW